MRGVTPVTLLKHLQKWLCEEKHSSRDVPKSGNKNARCAFNTAGSFVCRFYRSSLVMLLPEISMVEPLWRSAAVAGGISPTAPSAISVALNATIKR